jgi:hypothetical protein
MKKKLVPKVTGSPLSDHYLTCTNYTTLTNLLMKVIVSLPLCSFAEDTSKTKKKEFQLKVSTLAKNIITRVQRVNGILKNSYIPVTTVATSPIKVRGSSISGATSPLQNRKWSISQRNSLPTFDVMV